MAVVAPRGQDLHLPTDLAGIALLSYPTDRSDENLYAALGPAANQIRGMLNRLGVRTKDDLQEVAEVQPNVPGRIKEGERYRVRAKGRSEDIRLFTKELFTKFGPRVFISEVSEGFGRVSFSELGGLPPARMEDLLVKHRLHPVEFEPLEE